MVGIYPTSQDLEALSKELNPVLGFYDPLNLAEADFWGQGNEATIGFLRHAEIKHGRVAMAAFVGYCVHANNIRFPWAGVGGDVPTTTNPPELWDSIPVGAQIQVSMRASRPSERNVVALVDSERLRVLDHLVHRLP